MNVIEDELKNYKEHFHDKIVFCNCDDPFESNFFKYFALNFNHLGLKKLICTSYAGSPISYTEFNDLPLFHKNEKMPYMIEITEVKDYNNDGAENIADIEYLLRNDKNTLTILDGDGDFRSDECVEFLKEADIVVTNPPFSLFREYVSQLMEYNKKFVIIGNLNAITYKEIFPLIKNNKIWFGCSLHATKCSFLVPDYYNGKNVFYEQGVKKAKVNNAIWLTNLDIPKRHEKIILYKTYNEIDYPKYANYSGIEVPRVSEIPKDYNGNMGVPITFLDKHNPDQFEILACHEPAIPLENARKLKKFKEYKSRQISIGGKICQKVYHRIFIKRRTNEN